MGKTLNDFSQFRDRSGKHSLTGQGGLKQVAALPKEATDAYEVYRPLKEQFSALRESYSATCAELESIGKYHPDWSSKAHRASILHSELGDLISIIQNAKQMPEAVVFMHVARKVLHRDTFFQILDEVRSLIGAKERDGRLFEYPVLEAHWREKNGKK